MIIGFLIALAGFFLVWKSDWMLSNFGSIGWFEVHLSSSGGSRFGYKIIGILFLVVGFLTMTGLLKDIALAILPRFFTGLKQ